MSVYVYFRLRALRSLLALLVVFDAPDDAETLAGCSDGLIHVNDKKIF